MKLIKEPSVLRRRFSIVNLLVSVVFVSLFNYFQFQLMDVVFLDVAKYTLQAVSREISELDYKSDDFRHEMSDIEAKRSVYVEIYNPRDLLVYTTDSNRVNYNPDDPKVPYEKLQPRVMKLISQETLPDNSFFEVRQEFYTTAEYLVYGCFPDDDTAIELYYSTNLIKDNANTARWTLLVLSVTILLLVISIISLIVKMYLDPVERIKKTTQKMANLDFNAVCPSFRNRELNELSENINFLSRSLSESMQNLENKNRKLESDIESERRQEKARRSFVANASHELKTPISIIKGYAEGMKYGIGCDSTEEYCDIIIEEADKMNSLVVRLMEQLQYSSASYNLKESSFSINALISDLIDGRRLDFGECGINLQVDIPLSFVGRGDTELLSSVFNNYFSNALSHLDSEMELKVFCKETEDAYRLSVYNSGKPVSGTDIQNIWQSFYRADKAHSRKEGRFGLGLSIVATIQDLHKQQYGVINREKGVEFWFDIKKASE